MNDSDLIDFVIGALNPNEQRSLELSIGHDPILAARLEQLRVKLMPLEADREPGAVPSGLAERTIRRLEAHLSSQGHLQTEGSPVNPLRSALEAVIEEPLPTTQSAEPAPVIPTPTGRTSRLNREGPETRTVGGRFRPDLIVACGIAFFALGLVLSAVGKARSHYQLLACQSNMQVLHAALTGYADTHDGRYPQVGRDSTADSFATTLVDAGQLPADFKVGCPGLSADESPSPVRYTYSLGFQTAAGQLVGLRREGISSEGHDLMPICADFPTASAAPISGPLCPHGPLMNVLFMGGHLRCTTSPLIGPNGDDIYLNVNGQVAAGIGFSDAVLGRPGDKP